jgi:oligopeptide transport system permease protein
MVRYMAQRVLYGLVTIWIVATLTFVMMHALPGDPFTSEKALPPAVLLNMKAKFHLDEPMWKQYVIHMKNVATWDLGPSFRQSTRSVNEIINSGFPVSAQIGLMALGVALVLGVGAGTVAAVYRNGWPDHLVTVLSTLGISQPSFVIATLLQYFLAMKLKLFPVALWGDGLQYAVLPVIALSFFPFSYFARLVRSSMLEVLSQDYMRTARAKGLRKPVIVLKHGLRNALLSVITVLGPQAAAILTGSLVVERIFALPGMGGDFVTSIFNRDYTVIMGFTIFYGVLIVAFTLLVDLAYTLVDPRIKLAD